MDMINSSSKILRYPGNLGGVTDTGISSRPFILFRAFDRKLEQQTVNKTMKFVNASNETQCNIYIEMPEKFTIPDVHQWNNESLIISGENNGIVSTGIEAITRMAKEGGKNITQGIGNLGGNNMGERLAKTTEVGARALYFNPNINLYYGGGSPRTLQFEFKFYPVNIDESNISKNIILSFNKYSRGTINSGVFELKFPSKWDIKTSSDYINEILNFKEENNNIEPIYWLCNQVNTDVDSSFLYSHNNKISEYPPFMSLSLTFTENRPRYNYK